MLAVCAAQRLDAMSSWYQVPPHIADFPGPASWSQQLIKRHVVRMLLNSGNQGILPERGQPASGQRKVER